MKRFDDKAAATVTVHDADKMGREGRRDIAAWLRRHANELVRDGHLYSKRFRGRYVINGSR